MRRSILMIFAAASVGLLVSSPAFSLDYYLSQDLGVHGLYHLCEYSNGRVYSFNATDLCPLQVSDDAPPPSMSMGQMGFYAGEYQDGMTKVCVYNVMGTKEAIRISSVGLCPQTYNFQ